MNRLQRRMIRFRKGFSARRSRGEMANTEEQIVECAHACA